MVLLILCGRTTSHRGLEDDILKVQAIAVAIIASAVIGQAAGVGASRIVDIAVPDVAATG